MSKTCEKTCGDLKCQVFSRWSTEEKWEAAKQFGLCYCVLNDDHLGQQVHKK